MEKIFKSTNTTTQQEIKTKRQNKIQNKNIDTARHKNST